MCPRFLFVDTNKSAHKGHHPHSHTWSTHGWKRTLTLDRAGERKKANLGCKTNQVVPITEHLLGNDISCAETHRLGPEKTEHGEGVRIRSVRGAIDALN